MIRGYGEIGIMGVSKTSVLGSNPNARAFSSIAQLEEHSRDMGGVSGSNPLGTTLCPGSSIG